MFRIDAGRTGRYCDGFSRRSFVQLGVAGMAAVTLPEVLRARAASAALGLEWKDTSVILLWLDGGPSHVDLYDMKPEAPAEFRGMWRPIPTNVPGNEINELLPRQARVADKFSIIRSLHHGAAAHNNGCDAFLTGHDIGGDGIPRHPSVGAIATKVCGARGAGMPAYVSVPSARTAGNSPGYLGASYLGPAHNPFNTGGEPNEPDFQVQDFNLPGGLSIDRLEDRRGLLTGLDQMRRGLDASGTAGSLDSFQRQAYDLVSGSAARRAFDIAAENPRLRDQYGRNRWGQSTLLARRLVEAGATFVTCHFGGWDNHAGLQPAMENFLPMLDGAVSTLFADLDDRGLLDRVLLLVCGEFGRTPRLNKGDNRGPGRDHWPDAICCLIGGGGVQGGRIVGATTAHGEIPSHRPLTPSDLHATIYRVLGVDPRQSFLNRAGRPIPILDGGEAIQELF